VNFNGAARLVVGLAISALLLVLLVRGVDREALQAALAATDLRLVPVAIGMYFVAVWIRSVRWRLLLPPGAAPTGDLFKALIVGFTVNNLLPIRLGEVARAYLLARWDAVPYGVSAASLVVERILDGLALATLLLTALLFVPAPTPYLLVAGLLIGAAFGIGALILALAAWNDTLLTSTLNRLVRPLPASVRSAIDGLTLGFLRGLRVVHGLGLLAKLVGLSLLAWLTELAMVFVLLLGMPMPHSFPEAIVAGAAANFATLVPSSPGYVGTFDGALSRVLQDTAGVSPAVGLAAAVLVHATLLVPVTLAGLVILWRSRLSLVQVSRAAPSAASS
jgi:uncharacterized protein (TIRG00374 family)